jgi:hypothetical protein
MMTSEEKKFDLKDHLIGWACGLGMVAFLMTVWWLASLIPWNGSPMTE